MGLPFLEGFIGSNLKTRLSQDKLLQEITSERESLRSLWSLSAQEAESLEGPLNLPVLDDSTKVQDFEAYRKQKLPKECALMRQQLKVYRRGLGVR